MCGTQLIADESGRLGRPYHCCSKCTKIIEKARYDVMKPGYKRKYSSPVDGQRVAIRKFHEIIHIGDAIKETE